MVYESASQHVLRGDGDGGEREELNRGNTKCRRETMINVRLLHLASISWPARFHFSQTMQRNLFVRI